MSQPAIAGQKKAQPKLCPLNYFTQKGLIQKHIYSNLKVNRSTMGSVNTSPVFGTSRSVMVL